jgi:hypothetical protein
MQQHHTRRNSNRLNMMDQQCGCWQLAGCWWLLLAGGGETRRLVWWNEGLGQF